MRAKTGNQHMRNAVTILFILAFVNLADAQTQRRPCGPDSLKGPARLLIPQGGGGADFRPTCEAHDNCYGTLGSDRDQCDLNWKSDMLSACQSANRKCACRRRAKFMHRVVSKHGQGAFDTAQSKAKGF